MRALRRESRSTNGHAPSIYDDVVRTGTRCRRTMQTTRETVRLLPSRRVSGQGQEPGAGTTGAGRTRKEGPGARRGHARQAGKNTFQEGHGDPPDPKSGIRHGHFMG